MLKKFKLAIFVFRRDQRLFDNNGLIEAIKQSQCVLPCFIFDKRQSQKENEYFAHNCFQFMVESLKDLEGQLKARKGKLYLFQGLTDDVIRKIIGATKAEAVFLNEDYTPFAKLRDSQIEQMCKTRGVKYAPYEDSLLIGLRDLPEDFPKYKVFTPFYKRLSQIPVPVPKQCPETRFYQQKIDFESTYPKHNVNPNVAEKGGRAEGLKKLGSLPIHYDKNRNDVNQYNSRLSAYNKFGCISIRQFYYTCKEEALTRQLYWRDFYYHICVMNGFESFQKKYRDLKWQGKEEHFEAWKEGVTGVPIVDAAMRCLKETGYMHNRLRMIVASYLTKDLLIDWKKGERHFAHFLVDYDPAQNNGGWQWASSTGTDSQPYFRIFNPELQSKTHDPSCKFIKKWIPELKNVDVKSIHEWQQSHINFKGVYIKPLVIHKVQKEKAIELFKSYGWEAADKGKSLNKQKQENPKNRSRSQNTLDKYKSK